MAIITIQGPTEKAAGIYYEVDTSFPPLGQGGMGQVMRGVRVDQRTGIRTDVAIKFLYDDLPDNAIERARREASIQIHNENLVEMFGFIEIAVPDKSGAVRPRYHVASELLTGVMLYDLLQGKTTDNQGNEMPFAKDLYNLYFTDRQRFALTIIKNLLSGVMALHDAGYIHRDIDPSNIMITANGKIKLIDFGIAKKLEPASAPRQHLTSAGQFMGKAAYAAPELVLGDVDHENETTDIYAVGIVLFELLTGHQPFQGTIQEVAAMQLNQKMPLGEVENKALQHIIATATAKKQGDRYMSASEFRVAIEQLIRGGGTASGKSSLKLSMPSMPAMPKMPKIPKKVWIGSAAAVAVAVLAIVLTPVIKKSAEASKVKKAEKAALAEQKRQEEQAKALADSLALEKRKAELASFIVDSPEDKLVTDSATAVQMKTAGKLYNEALAEVKNPATAAEGVAKLQTLADLGYKSSVPAMFTLSSILNRNKMLQPEILAATAELYPKPDYAKANEINTRILEIDSSHYPAMLQLALDYMFAEHKVYSQDAAKAKELLERGLPYAKQANDSTYLYYYEGYLKQAQ